MHYEEATLIYSQTQVQEVWKRGEERSRSENDQVAYSGKRISCSGAISFVMVLQAALSLCFVVCRLMYKAYQRSPRLKHENLEA